MGANYSMWRHGSPLILGVVAIMTIDTNIHRMVTMAMWVYHAVYFVLCDHVFIFVHPKRLISMGDLRFAADK